MTERSLPVEIKLRRLLNALAFSSNSELLVSGCTKGVRVWRVDDGEQVATMKAPYVRCVAASKDGKIAAGTYFGEVIIWEASETYKKVFAVEGISDIYSVDFSPDGTQLIIASANNTATIWNISTRQCASIHHDGVASAKYSPLGDRIVTASPEVIRVYASNDRRLLVEIPANINGSSNASLLWSQAHLVVVSDSKIKQIDASTGSAISEWPVPAVSEMGCIALSTHGSFIAYSSSRTVTFWHVSTRTQLGTIQHTQDICSLAISSDDRFLAIGGEGGKITIKRLSYITEPDIQIDDAALDSWKLSQLTSAEALLTEALPKSRTARHHVLASRALVRARLQQWDAATNDAEQSVNTQPSVIGLIAKSVALVRNGKKHEAYRACDIAFEHSHSTYISFILLMKAIIVFMAGEHNDAISRVDNLIVTLHFNSICRVVQAQMYFLLGNMCMENGDYEDAKQQFERARAQIPHHPSQPLLLISLVSGWQFDDLSVAIQQRLCEALYAGGRLNEAGESLLKMTNTLEEEIYKTQSITKWVSDFSHRCLSAPSNEYCATWKATRQNGPSKLHAIIHSPTSALLLKEWAKATLAIGSWQEALVAAVGFMFPRFTIYRVLCERLAKIEFVMDASECFCQMADELAEQTDADDEEIEWILGFKRHCLAKLESLGNAAMDAERYEDAISQYSAALSLDPAVPQDVFIKRSKAYLAIGLWEDALHDADEVIMKDPESPWGYEQKHAALHEGRDYNNAINAFEVMLSKLSHSSEPEICDRHQQYVSPGQTKAKIRKAVQDAIRETPRVLIETRSGRLCNKSEQAAAFETLPIFMELISSMTTHIDHARIEREVTEYYRYAMFSHTWEDDEPLFDQVQQIVVYDLEESPTNNKLLMFCMVARDSGFHWAWSDTCCINKADHFVLQEALVAMFKWYEGSALTIIFLRGVRSSSQRGALVRSVWNTRAWTLQEYHASKVVRFYTEDWTPYLNFDIPNHKDSSEIIAEMEEATGISARALMALRPGSDDIREKLCLASGRETTLVEDAAYSLLGMFSISLPVVYGEGDQALGRLLAQLLTSAGDTSILAWTGRPGSFNSCLPSGISVFNRLSASHIPTAINAPQMDAIVTKLQAAPSLDFALVMKLHDRLSELPIALFAGQRMKLPCISFELGPLLATRSTSGYIFRIDTPALGNVEIETAENLSQLNPVYIIHPWIDFLLNRQPVKGTPEIIPEEITTDQFPLATTPSFDSACSLSTAPQTRAARLAARFGLPFAGRPAGRDSTSLRPALSQLEAFRVLARLRQPFGGLLLAPSPGNVAAFKRVAADSLITVQIGEITPAVLQTLVEGVRMLDVL